MRDMREVRSSRPDDNVPGRGAVAHRRRLLSSYVLNLRRGVREVRAMMLRDIRCLRDLGAHRQASDIEAALETFLRRYPESNLADGAVLWTRRNA